MRKSLWILSLVALGALTFAGIAYAADAVAPEAAKFDWNNLWKGAICGAIAAIIGWVKSKDFSKESFNAELCITTAICGLVAGALAAYQNKPTADVYSWFTSVGGAMVVESIVKALWRRAAPKSLTGATNPSMPK